jgi:hypothetical protein
MRRKWYVALAFALTAALAAPAGAGLPSVELENQYEGRVERDPFTYFGFDVIGRAGQKRVANVTAHIGYTCDDGNSRRESAQVEGRLRIKKRRFAGVLETSLTARTAVARGTNVTVAYRIRGRLLRDGVARGRVDTEVFGTDSLRGFPAQVRCYSGDVDWRAKRGADVELPV